MIIDDKGFQSGLTPNNMKFKMGFCVSEPKQRNGSWWTQSIQKSKVLNVENTDVLSYVDTVTATVKRPGNLPAYLRDLKWIL
jgi:hypothetical protein